MVDAEVRRFLKAAGQRSMAAELLAAHRHYRDATYLAGYVIECALKALLLSYVPVKSRSKFVVLEFHGRRAHDYSLLLELLRSKGVTIPIGIRQAVMQAYRIWSVDLRYLAGVGWADETEALLDTGTLILDWVKERI
jgi:HEPN domain-containing protein